jgi:hypothetical protein
VPPIWKGTTTRESSIFQLVLKSTLSISVALK